MTDVLFRILFRKDRYLIHNQCKLFCQRGCFVALSWNAFTFSNLWWILNVSRMCSSFTELWYFSCVVLLGYQKGKTPGGPFGSLTPGAQAPKDRAPGTPRVISSIFAPNTSPKTVLSSRGSGQVSFSGSQSSCLCLYLLFRGRCDIQYKNTTL